MQLSRPFFRILAITVAVAWGAGCGGTSGQMRPQLAQVHINAPSELEANTSCAGDVCFTYVKEAE